MAQGKIRPRKDGGCSLCRASDENVGKRRCCHILSDATFKVRQENGINFVDIDGIMDKDKQKTKISVAMSEKAIRSFVSQVNGFLSKAEKKEIKAEIKKRLEG